MTDDQTIMISIDVILSDKYKTEEIFEVWWMTVLGQGKT